MTKIGKVKELLSAWKQKHFSRAPLGSHGDAVTEELAEQAFAAGCEVGAAEQKIRDMRAVVEACTACEGHGFIVATTTGQGHGCNGDEGVCNQVCPIPVPVQGQQQCEYCGRPCQAIREQGEIR